MASGAVSETVLFIGAIIIATALVGAFGALVGNVADGIRFHGNVLGAELKTDIAVINDPLAMTTSPLTVYVKNTGVALLYVNETTVMLDGEVSGNKTYDVLDSGNDLTWRGGDVLKIVVNDLTVSSGDHRIRVVAGTGVDAELEFHKA